MFGKFQAGRVSNRDTGKEETQKTDQKEGVVCGLAASRAVQVGLTLLTVELQST